MVIDENVVKRIISLVDMGLVSGLGNPIPGQMCVEAVVFYATHYSQEQDSLMDPDLECRDDPDDCVSPLLRQLKIKLNDCSWSTRMARAKGLRKLAVLQLGTNHGFNEQEFFNKLYIYAQTKEILNGRKVAQTKGLLNGRKEHLIRQNIQWQEWRANCSYIVHWIIEGFIFGDDSSIIELCQAIENILIEMNVPGVQWLSLL